MIYLDNAATTKPLFSAVKNAEALLSESFFNPSATYSNGIEIKKLIESARSEILKFFPIGYDLIFTSCGTEADNMAIFSFAKRGNIVTTSGEHSAVFECFNELKKRGLDVRFAPVCDDGSVDLSKLLDLVDEKTSLVSVVHVNNETGAINDINAISKRVKAKNPSAVFHSDGVQAFGKLPYKICDSIDMYSISAHKIGGLKGVGGLIKRKKLTVHPILFGGGQESGLRSGTENVFGIKVFEEAVKHKYLSINENYQKVLRLKELFIQNLTAEGVKIISGENSSAYVLSLSAEGLRGEVIMHMMEDYGVIIGTGSACSSKNPHSRILKACGHTERTLSGALRVSFIEDVTEEEVIYSAQKLSECINKLRGIMKK